MINLKNKEIEKIIERKIEEKMQIFQETPHPKDELIKQDSKPFPPKEINLPKPKELNLKPLLKINFTDDFEKLMEIFNDEDTVISVISTLQNSPEEIQVVAKIVLDLHKKIDVLGGEESEN